MRRVTHNQDDFLREFYKPSDQCLHVKPTSVGDHCQRVLAHKFKNYYGYELPGKVLQFAAKSIIGSMMECIEKGDPVVRYPFVVNLTNKSGGVNKHKQDRKDIVMEANDYTSDRDYKLHMRRSAQNRKYAQNKEVDKITNEITSILNELLC